MSFVRTPFGVILHKDNHRAAVEKARTHDLKGMLMMLEPAEDLSPEAMFGGIDLQAGPPVECKTTPLTVEVLEEAVRATIADTGDLHPDTTCPTCRVQLVPEHAHQRCPSCGYRDSCCF